MIFEGEDAVDERDTETKLRMTDSEAGTTREDEKEDEEEESEGLEFLSLPRLKTG